MSRWEVKVGQLPQGYTLLYVIPKAHGEWYSFCVGAPWLLERWTALGCCSLKQKVDV